jgi:hypothetical protein
LDGMAGVSKGGMGRYRSVEEEKERSNDEV